MDFHLEERRAWVRTSTHTVIMDRDPDFGRFATDSTGFVARLIRVWQTDSSGESRFAYLGAMCLGPRGYRRQDLTRVFRRLTDHDARNDLKALLKRCESVPVTELS